MANVEVEGSGSSRNISNGDDWVDHLEELLRSKNEETTHKREHMFFPVPKPLPHSFQHFYIPQVVAIGPRHFGNPELRLQSHKVEAMRRMESRIQKMSPDSTLKSIVEEKIIPMEEWIRDCYEDEIPNTSKQLAWMVTSDACFIYELILFYCRNVQFMNVEAQCIPEAKYTSIFDSCDMNPMWKWILFDVLLFENQIPLGVLELLVEIEMGSGEALEKKLYKEWLVSLSVGVFSWYVSPKCRRGENPFYGGASSFRPIFQGHGRLVD